MGLITGSTRSCNMRNVCYNSDSTGTFNMYNRDFFSKQTVLAELSDFRSLRKYLRQLTAWHALYDSAA